MPSPESTTFMPGYLARRRRVLGLSRAELGRLVGNGHPATDIADWETGRGIPSLPALRCLVRVLDCPMADLFDTDADPLLVAALRLEREILLDAETAPDIPDHVIEKLARLLPVRGHPQLRDGAA